MARAATPQIISDIQNPDSTASRIEALRLLKNEIIGHDQRKEAWIGWGIIPLLSQILAGRRGAGKKTTGGEVNGHTRRQHLARSRSGRSDDDEVCLQAILIIGSLAQGGPPFISPIAAGGIFPLLLSIFSSPDCHPSLFLAVLETLNTIADRFPLYQQQSLPHAKQLSSLLYSRDHVETLRRLLIGSTSSSSQRPVTLAANLIAKTCSEESYKAILGESGVLDALAFKLSTFVVAQGFVLPGAENNIMDSGALKTLPPAAPPNAQLAPILRAITLIIENSKSRAEHFVSSPAVVAVFPKQIPEFSPNDIKKSPWGATYFSGFAVPRHSATNPIDAILPSVPAAQSKNSNFPPLGSHTSFGRQSNFFSPPLSFSETPSSDEDESALISWLFTVIRSESSQTRLVAARLATLLFRLGLAKKHRVPMFGYLLIPLLIRIFEKDYEAPGDVSIHESALISTTLRAKEEAPAILASLVMDSRELQKHAAEAEAIPKLSQMLKETFSPISEAAKPMWNSDKNLATTSNPTQPELCLGPRGCSPAVYHRMKVREGALKALAALSLFKEDYRRMICDNGVVPYIIDSMKPCEEDSLETLDCNPPSTLLAACAAARSLTRSVSALRTNLIDAGVATPMFTLIKFRDIAVQIAATSVVCNLAMDFSPMKDAIIGANMIPILCEHSHSSNTSLRLESIWALKHIAYNSTNDIKMKIVEELEPGWLKQVICHDPGDPPIRRKGEDDMGGTSSLGMEAPNSAGERVDILNPMDGVEGETIPGQDGDYNMTNTVVSPKPTSLDVSLIDYSRRRKLAVSGDLDQTKQARRDDLQVQEQTLDLLRNLICGVGAPEMIDYLFQEVGQNDLFNILADKLRPKPIVKYGGRKDSLSSSSKCIPVPTEILCSVTYIVIHIAAGLPRHRQLLIQHPTLLKLMMPLFNNPDKQVRVNCVWVVINLTIADDQMDHASCCERAMKLESLGVMEKLLSLENDAESDVKERTKTALSLMHALLQ
ncbi:armadillo repeat protein [Histoplasma capsulatum]|uniref:Armadillo repeat protein n=1 Tax=Ajellomyces capsulatus TaxID=5037 RepID=A0A8A1M407_AJECA|nr:armadillo repeat protein [Histoplasma capsulatum]